VAASPREFTRASEAGADTDESRTLAPALALISNLADSGANAIAEKVLLRALAFADYLETHPRRAYAAALTRAQAFVESLDPDKLERLGRYEVHLDRKLERMLSMLLRLKDLRQGTVTG
jgi:hypothetical protein